MERYVALLQRWGATINLTSSRASSATALHDLIDGCLCIIPHLPNGIARLIDLGSGQGFPAIPLAIETGIAVELIEADRRKAAFLSMAMAELGLDGAVHPSRIEAMQLAPARCVTARALAPVVDLIGLALPFLTSGGCGLFLKGAMAPAEIGDVPCGLPVDIKILPTNRPPTSLVKVTRLG